jgi:4'-phosphopantetheinyl transferase EntD
MNRHAAPRPVAHLSVLGRNLYGFEAAAPLPIECLYPGERQQYEALGPGHRRAEWLIGRSALRAAAEIAGLSADSSRLSFPHANLSLSHAPGIAVAVAARPTVGDCVVGLGVDFERDRPMSPDMLRLFATNYETACHGDRRAAHALRLWTIKEAVFKACPRNAGLRLNDFEVQQVSPDGKGCAVLLPDQARFITTSRRHATGWLSVALCMEIDDGRE